jgi:hypothetical protein
MAWKKSALKHSKTFSFAKFDFMDMFLVALSIAKQDFKRPQKNVSAGEL